MLSRPVTHKSKARQSSWAVMVRGTCAYCVAMVQVAVQLRPLNGREVAGGDTEAVTVTPEDPHTLQVQDSFPNVTGNSELEHGMSSGYLPCFISARLCWACGQPNGRGLL